jgi:hypothetical protein
VEVLLLASLFVLLLGTIISLSYLHADTSLIQMVAGWGALVLGYIGALVKGSSKPEDK